MLPDKKIYLIDGNAYIHRAFHAIKQIFTTSSGQPVNAVYGFTRMLLKILKEEKPDYMVVCFDFPAPTFRHKEFESYKANRKETPEELKSQMPLCKDIVDAMNIVSVSKKGFEADDLIGTLCKKALKKDLACVIVTGDKDVLQLVNDRTVVLNEQKGILFDPEKVEEYYGVTPGQITDLLSLSGDSTDNIPGVRGIGPKTARRLIQEFGGLRGLLDNLGSVKENVRDKILDSGDDLFFYKKLLTIDTDVDIDIDISECILKGFDNNKLMKIFKDLEFRSLIKDVVQESREEVQYTTIMLEKDLESLVDVLGKNGSISIDLETTSVDPLSAEIVGFSFSVEPCSGWYIPVAHSYEGVPKQLALEKVLGSLKGLLEDGQILKIGQNIKYDMKVLKKFGIEIKGVYFDTMIASYVLNPSRQNHNLNDISIEYLNHKMTPITELLGHGKKQITMDKVEIERVSRYACSDADIVFRLVDIMTPLMKEKQLYKLFSDVEMQLIGILADMETAGILVDRDYLAKLSLDFMGRLKKLEEDIYALAGSEFNINSPKQLAGILFDKLGLPVRKKTKTGFSTSEDVLRELMPLHELPGLLISFRELQKLKSTYVDALPGLVDNKTGRIHTSFNQTVTATGRLSSSEPNLQNIPVRTELGKKIRKAFIPSPGHVFLSADYSQIDLRVLAHVSGDKNLVKAFKENRDVHSQTAAEIFSVNMEQVTSEMRNIAKTVNFGLSYGMSPFGLARDLGITREEAKRYVDQYFIKYPGVKKYMEDIIQYARSNGFVTTLLNRTRYLPEINSKDGGVRAFTERMAINTPIQGTAADIIKLAMLKVDKKIRGMRSRLLLQIHDELLFEVYPGELNDLKIIVKESMENALKLDVPVIVDMKNGPNWAELG